MSVIEKILSYHAELVRKHTSSKSIDKDLHIISCLDNDKRQKFPGVIETQNLDQFEFEVLDDPDGSDEEILELTTPVMKKKKAKKFAYSKQSTKVIDPSPKSDVKNAGSFTSTSPFSELHSIMKQNLLHDQISPLEVPSPVFSARSDSNTENQSALKMFRKPFLKPRIISLKQRLGLDEHDEKMKKLLAVKKIKKTKKKSKMSTPSLYYKNVRMGWFEPVLDDIMEDEEETTCYFNIEVYTDTVAEKSISSDMCSEGEETEIIGKVECFDEHSNREVESDTNSASDEDVSDASLYNNPHSLENQLNFESEDSATPPEKSSGVFQITEISSDIIDLNELRKPHTVDHDFLDPVILVNNRQSLRRARDHLKLRIAKEVPRRSNKRKLKLRKRVKSGVDQVAGVFSKQKDEGNVGNKSQRSLFSVDMISKATIHTKNTLSSLVGYTAEEKLI